MFPLPFKDFISLFKRPKSYLEDGIDRLSSWIASSFMLIFCTISTVGFNMGNHFDCMIPGDYNNEWQKFMFAYCYVQPQFFAYNPNANNDENIRLPQIYYFSWLPYFFFGHALAFYLPKIVWKSFAGVICRLDLECILKEAKLINESKKDDEKKKRVATLVAYLTTTLKFSHEYASTYFLLSSTALFFLFKKFLYVFIAYTQFYAICYYIGQGNMYWGFEVLSHSLQKNVYFPSKFFPLFTSCYAPIANDGYYEKKAVSCIMGMNVIYEKLYVFTYFLLLGIIIASLLSAMYYTILFANPFRTSIIDNLLGFKQSIVPLEHVETFTRDYLGADGYLSVLLIKYNFGDEVAQEILKELWNQTSSFTSSLKPKENSKLPLLTSTPNRYAPIPTFKSNGNNKGDNANSHRYSPIPSLKSNSDENNIIITKRYSPISRCMHEDKNVNSHMLVFRP
jgi:hypothetical protein